MAKKKDKKNEVDNDLDFGDLDDLEVDTDFGDLEDIDADSRSPSKAGVAKELGKEATKGFFDGLIKQTAKKSLPDEYSSNYYELMDYADFAKETFDTNKSKVNKSIYKLGKEVKKILPFQFKMLDNYLEKFESDNEEQRQQSEDEMREGSINANLTGIFDKQLEITKAIEAKHEAKDQIESKERMSAHKMNIDILGNIDANISNSTAFTLQISKEYYRKSLELQFKSYFVQADMLKTMREYYKGFSLQFDNIVKNTGLPEFVKLNNTERLSDIIRTQMVQNTYKNLFSNSEYVKNVKGKVSKMIGDKVSSFTDGVDNVTDQLSMINSASEGGNAGQLLANIGSGMLGSTLGEKLGDKISPKLKERLKNNKGINAGANYLSLLSNSPSTLFSTLRGKVQKKQSEYSDESDPVRLAASKMFGGLNELLGVTEPGKQEFKVTSSSVLNHNKPAIFDNKVHRSITEVIPMYLAKTLKINTDLFQAYSHVNANKLKNGPAGNEELTYDYDGRKLVTNDQLRASTEKSILEGTSSKNKLNSTVNTILSGSLGELNKDKTKNKDAIKLINDKKSDKLLNDYLHRASKDDSIKFDYKTLVEDYSKNDKLKGIVEADPKLKALLETIKKAKVDRKKTNLDNKMSDVKRKYPVTGVKQLFSDTSMLAGKKLRNVLKDVQAEIIAKAFTKFITGVGRDISMENVVSGECFKFITSKEFEGLKKNITIFINEARIVKNEGDLVKESSFAVLLGMVNRSLKDNFELDPSVFQTLYEYNPALGEKGALGVENLVERKLFQNKDEQYVSLEDIRSSVKVPKEKIDEARTENVKKGLLESISRVTTNFKQELTNAGSNPFEIARVVIKNAKEATDTIRKASEKAYNTATSKIDGLKETLSKLTDETIDGALDKLVKQFDEAAMSIDEMIKKESEARDEELKTLEEAKVKLTELMNDPAAIRDIEKSISRVTKFYDGSIKAMNKLRDTLRSQKNNMIQLKSSGVNNRLELVKRIRDEIETTLKRVKSILESTQQQPPPV